jgi:hypothetical protein
LFKGYGAKVGLGNMRVKAENRMVTEDLLVENEHYAVVYNPSVGGIYDVMRKVSTEEVRQNITYYRLPDNATADVKSIAENRNRKWKLSHKKRLIFIEKDNGIFLSSSLSYFQK